MDTELGHDEVAIAGKRNAGLLVGVTCWCPMGAEARAGHAASCLEKLVRQTEPIGEDGWDLLVVDNDVEHPRLRAAIAAVEVLPWVSVERLSPQRGWAGARNVQMEFFLRGYWTHLAMCDQDLHVPDPLWLRDAESAAVAESLEGFMLVSDHSDLRGVTTLKSGRLAWISREFLGGIHVVSRRAVEILGGYNVLDFPEPWGFHDCEYGLRLRAAGLLDSCRGYYVDPVMRTVLHADATPGDARHAAMKQRVVAEYYPVFMRRVIEIQLGQRLFQPLTPFPRPERAAAGGAS